MALSVTTRNRSVVGDRVVVQATVTFDSSYPTGGESLSVSDLGGAMREINWVNTPAINVAGSRLVVWDRANAKLLLFTALSTEATNASNQSTISVDVEIWGK